MTITAGNVVVDGPDVNGMRAISIAGALLGPLVQIDFKMPDIDPAQFFFAVHAMPVLNPEDRGANIVVNIAEPFTEPNRGAGRFLLRCQRNGENVTKLVLQIDIVAWRIAP